MFKTQSEILADYQTSIAELEHKIAAIKIKIDRFSIVRLLLLVVEIFAIVAFVKANTDLATIITGILLFVPIVCFALIVKKQNALDEKDKFYKNLLWVNKNEVEVLIGSKNGYDDGKQFENETHPYLADLDIFGRSSLFELINRCSTFLGLNLLSNHLSNTATKAEILNRQEAVKELQTKIDETFNFRANLKGHNPEKIEQLKLKFKGQLSNELKFTRNTLLRFYVKSLTFIIPVCFLTAILITDRFWGVLALVAIINAALTFFYMKHINLAYFGFGGNSALLNSYATVIKWTEDIDWKSNYIKSLFKSQQKVSEEIKSLAKIIQAFDVRLNILVSSVLNFFLMWDVKCCIRLDKWQQSSFNDVENGLDRIGYFEELISIATLSHNHQDWNFPIIEDNYCLSATDVGHPLIAKSKRVDNDFSLKQHPTVDIITGSNMAGKSTFLRTVGINMILAYLGAPVCAKNMRLSIFKIFTYMRIKDSLNESTSTFKAELNRLKMILSNVDIHQNALVLIDEMLRGTNSKDKFLGSKVFIEKLIHQKTSTLFATHDLQLSELEENYPNDVRNYHFDIQINNGEMEFDYKIKSGPCKTFNAALLLKEIGLALD